MNWAGLALALTLGTVGNGVAQEPSYQELWSQGRTYAEFTARISTRRNLWARNTERAAVERSVLTRARSVPGLWRLLVVAFDGCSDSVSTVPYLAALVDSVPGLEMRIIPPDAGQAIMTAHPTPDGRAATPTILILNAAWQPVAAWVERPSELQSWYLSNPDGLSDDARFFEKMLWYDRDAGASTLAEVVALLELGGHTP